MQYGILIAILSAVLWGIMNVYDKYVISCRVKSPRGYTAVVGITNLCIAVFFGIFLDWSQITLLNLLFPALTGFCLGIAAFFYILTLEKDDVSHMVGIFYVYPLIVAVLSYIFLKEKLIWIGYVGVILVIAGAILLSVRIKKVKLESSAWFILGVIIFTSLDEFFIKLSTNNIPVWNGIIASYVVTELTLLCGLFNSKIRKDFWKELHNFRLEIVSALLSFGGIVTLFLAMKELPATIVSSIGALQPLIVLIGERITGLFVGGLTKDNLILPKTGAILLIVVGIVLLYITV